MISLGSSACRDSVGEFAQYAPRDVVVEKWDTVFVAGGENINDTLIAASHLVTVVDSVVIVADGMQDRLVALHASTGRLLWMFGGPGQGPEEFRGISDIDSGQDDRVWALDFGNGRIAEVGLDGQLQGLRTLHHLPAPPESILPLKDRVIAMSPGAAEPYMEIGLDSLELHQAFALSWPESVPNLADTRVALARGPDSTWVSAFKLGPGFTVWNGSGPKSFSYREPIPFASRPTPKVREMGADSARWGAVSLDVVGDEIFMLFGGRPARRPHPAEPTVWIDVYSLEGNYLHSLRLPFDVSGMATDGHTFYVLPEEGVPRVIALQPRKSD